MESKGKVPCDTTRQGHTVFSDEETTSIYKWGKTC